MRWPAGVDRPAKSGTRPNLQASRRTTRPMSAMGRKRTLAARPRDVLPGRPLSARSGHSTTYRNEQSGLSARCPARRLCVLAMLLAVDEYARVEPFAQFYGDDLW